LRDKRVAVARAESAMGPRIVSGDEAGKCRLARAPVVDPEYIDINGCVGIGQERSASLMS
jgi:hypothetical protein